MSREKKKEEMTTVTFRIPKDMYEDYKTVLKNEGRIVTYDLRKHIKETITDGTKY